MRNGLVRRWKSLAKVALLIDSFSGNTGDEAIRLVMQDFLTEQGVDYEVADPFSFAPTNYEIVVVGGGHLIRDKGNRFYDVFRVRGRHVLNAAGVTAVEDLEYLQDYRYVSVRSESDRKRVAPVVPDASVAPCVSMLLEPAPSGIKLAKPAIGLHFNSISFAACFEAPRYMKRFQGFEKLFIPFMAYDRDQALMRQMAAFVDNSRVLPYLGPRRVCDLIGRLNFLVCSRLHAAIFAYVNEIPFIVFPYHEKVEAFMRERGLERWLFRNAEEMYLKLKQLIESPPEYRVNLRKDKETLERHLKRLRQELRDTVAVHSVATRPLVQDARQENRGRYAVLQPNPCFAVLARIMQQQRFDSAHVKRLIIERLILQFLGHRLPHVGRWVRARIVPVRSTSGLLLALLQSAIGKVVERPFSILIRSTLGRTLHESELEIDRSE